MYKVQCTVVGFVCDEEKHPCHFGYKVGDVITYDGEKYEGRICPSLLPTMNPIVHQIFLSGHKASESIPYRYRGPDERDPEMFKYDGAGFRRKKTEGGEKSKINTSNPRTGRAWGQHFICGDTRTLVHFSAIPIDISDSPYCQPFYRREIAVLEKIEAEPGINKADILSRFTDFERDEIVPPLTPVFLDVLMEPLEDMGYITIDENGCCTATGKEPPSRPVIGEE